MGGSTLGSPGRRLKLVLEYDGTDFSGWQFQVGRRTVQGTIEQALARLLGAEVEGSERGATGDIGALRSRVVAAGRTDAGVHASGQVAHVDVATPLSSNTIRRGLNALLARDVRVLEVSEAPPGFHARFSALSRTYRYVLRHRDSALERRFAWAPRFPWRDEPIRAFLDALKGKHSFKSFCRAREGENDYICNVLSVEWAADDAGATLTVTADRFLHSMVRGIVGALYDLGRGYWTFADLERLLEYPDRVGAVRIAPPQGLTLVRVAYPDESRDVASPFNHSVQRE